MATSGGLLALATFCHAMPKIELHAHLHGSIRPSTLAELGHRRGMDRASLDFLFTTGEKSLSDCFKIFGLIHKLVTDVEVVKRITGEVLHDMDIDNVCYAEIRTTPRPLDDGTSKRGYVEAVIDVFNAFAGRLIPRLILSIDRSRPLDDAMDTVNLCVEMRRDCRYIVGVDFSGNPTLSSFAHFEPAFALARQHGLKVTVHTAEVDNDEDTAAVLRFRPDRLGHALYLNDIHLAELQRHPLPIEICPTSNMKTLELSSHSQHPTLERFLRDDYPISVCTDDFGVFDTSLTQEYHIVAKEFSLTRAHTLQLAQGVIEQIFEGEDIKAQLRERFKHARDSLLQLNGMEREVQ